MNSDYLVNCLKCSVSKDTSGYSYNLKACELIPIEDIEIIQ